MLSTQQIRAAPEGASTRWSPPNSTARRWGIPALAVDPITGAGKLNAQAHTWQRPALVAADSVVRDRRGTVKLQYWWRWCLSPQRRQLAAERAASPPPGADDLVGERPDTHEASVLKPR